ncbi:B-4DMT family transporter [Nocardia sp. alder85J]|uniref:B-4DMT family transporter n=1 Tax=Nocardia sp. alder85J TaxID=2862949 RepID=UPI001CD6B162|nr:B-4DMT family transporter [Nocardia sp. alder85J]MCX4091187.1 B-4DMT family transporter [Nocardia sp. alder85J]
MSAWVLRATAFGVLVVALRTLLGFAMIHWPTQGSWLRILCLAVILVSVAAWGLADGRNDRQANPDPERGGADLTVRWLKAGVAGGLGSGLVAWVVDLLPKMDLGGNSLVFELTAGASFIVLLIFVPAMAGVALGRFLADRENRNGAAAAA